MSPSNGLSCDTGGFSHCRMPHRFLQPEVLRLYFPTLEPWVAWSVSLPICSSWFIHTQMWDHLVHQFLPWPPVCQPLPCHASSPPWLPISATLTSLDQCFSFNFLDFHTVWLSDSSGCFWFLNWWLSFFWLCKEAKDIYLHLHLAGSSSIYLALWSLSQRTLNSQNKLV